MKSEDIRNRRWTEQDREAVRRIRAAPLQAAGLPASRPSAEMPGLTARQLASLVRFPDTRPPKVAVSVRLDVRVLDWLKSSGPGHLSRINHILANLMEAEQRAQR